MAQYAKPFLDIPGQIALLESRGMVINDRAKAEEYLSRIGYYRLSAFWYPFRDTPPKANATASVTRLDTFKPNTDFKTVVDLYTFDKGLRLQMMDALERIEISLRTSISLTLGAIDPWAHRDQARVSAPFVQARAPAPNHGDWVAHLDKKARHSKDEFAAHFRKKYPSSQMPIWIACELLDFGPLSILFSGLGYSEQKQIAGFYQVRRPALLGSWMQALTFVRNTTAHHARLWNRALVNQPSLPKTGEIPLLDHLTQAPNSNRRVYAACAVARYLLLAFNPRCNWHNRLKAAVGQFPANPNVTIAAAGFPAGWEALPLWV